MAEFNILALVAAYEQLVCATQAGTHSVASHYRHEVEQLLDVMGLEHVGGFIGGPVQWKMPTYEGILETLMGYYSGTPVPKSQGEVFPGLPPIPPRDEPDRLPKTGRNVRIGCEQYESGTWIHGRPHDCPRWARR